MRDVIKIYAHDFRGMKMSEEEMADMLRSFMEEVIELLPTKFKRSGGGLSELDTNGNLIVEGKNKALTEIKLLLTNIYKIKKETEQEEADAQGDFDLQQGEDNN